MKLNTTEELLEDIRQGRMVVLMDDEDRENEGDLIIAAEKVTAQDINFMATHARGLICLTLTEQRCEQLGLPLMVDVNDAAHGTNFTVSIEAAEGVTTGISAADRAKTVQVAVAPKAVPLDIVQPGHIFPLKAQAGGVLSRAGHTEAGCDLAQLAGHEAAAVIVEIMNDDGTMARRPDLEAFAEKHNLKIGTIADLIHHRMVNDRTMEHLGKRQIETAYGEFTLHTYFDAARNCKHFALVKGEIDGDKPVPVRVHLPTVVRDLFAIDHIGSYERWTMDKAMKYVANEGCGIIIVILQEETPDKVEDDLELLSVQRPKPKNPSETVYMQIGAGSQILRDLGAKKLKIMSAPYRFGAISGFDLEVTGYVESEFNPIEPKNPENP
ncbi:MAG: 3,4-dihydroxy-2-butanone-4-phosphate synthase [Gammaproteobacteria bacterium]|nr:MAG: 3,4-dihydroxy-2-butanone-4-phosphate synthase [Gammaproteobacteria bacterium]